MGDRPVRQRESHVGPLERSGPLSRGAAGAAQPSRRNLLRWAALAAGTLGASGPLAACGGGGGRGQQPVAGSLPALVGNVQQQLSLLTTRSELPAGRSRLAFGLEAENNRLVEGVAPQVWLAKDQTSKALGPYPARWLEMTSSGKAKDRSPHAPTGFYLAEVDLPAPGDWLVVALVEVATQRAAAQGAIVVSQQVLAQVGTEARSGPTPVATSPSATAKICTRTPPCPLHYISLDRALDSGKPTVLSFATPLLCASRLCGPVVDEQVAVFNKLGTKANFIHLELYPERDIDKPAPLFTAWGFQSEPWMIVIDRDRIIRGRLGDGPTAASEIEAALRPLLP
jgi:hypothetical protein